jgi:hypothetical protein
VGDSKHLRFVEELHRKTLEGRIPWEAMAGEDAFRAAFARYAVTTHRWQESQQGQNAWYSLRIQDESGAVIEEISDAYLGDVSIGDLRGRDVLRQIFEGARRRALDVDEALDTLLEALQGLAPPPSAQGALPATGQ